MGKSSKPRTYSRVKRELKMKEYLNSEDAGGRKLLARLGSGTNALRIESWRNEDMEIEKRKCWFGCNAIEYEEYFLMGCRMYENIRQEVVEKIWEEKFKEKGIELMMGKGNETEISYAVEYIKRATARRRRLLEFKE